MRFFWINAIGKSEIESPSLLQDARSLPQKSFWVRYMFEYRDRKRVVKKIIGIWKRVAVIYAELRAYAVLFQILFRDPQKHRIDLKAMRLCSGLRKSSHILPVAKAEVY